MNLRMGVQSSTTKHINMNGMQLNFHTYTTNYPHNAIHGC